MFNLFGHLIPHEALNRMERGKRRQAIFPDFRLAMPSPVIGRQKAVGRRAGLLQNEYRMKARNVDRSVIGVGEGVIGPIERKLNEFGDLLGLVVGA